LTQRKVRAWPCGTESGRTHDLFDAPTVTTPLTAGQRALLEAELIRRQGELDRQLADHQNGLSRVEHARELLSQDSDDVSHREADREMDMALSDRDIAELGAVSAALLRLKEGRYGLCSDCGLAIAFDRLKVEPWALRCIGCEGRRERADRH
jgi:DnaK suppressor protein